MTILPEMCLGPKDILGMIQIHNPAYYLDRSAEVCIFEKFWV